MKDFSMDQARKNIFQLLYYSGLTDEQFANILNISIRWLRYIISGKYNFKIAEIEKAANFFNLSFNTLTSKQLKISKNLRENLLSAHKSNSEYLKYLEDNPTIPYAIEFKLLDDPDFQGKELEVKQIREIFKKSGWDFESSSLTNGLKSMSNLITWRKSPTKGGTHVYSKKK